MGKNGLVVAFICNHCPYVQAIQSRLITLALDLKAHDINVLAINSNDAVQYPEDDFPSMQRVAQELAYPFPYVHDVTQSVAKAYQVVCTPDFFGLNADKRVLYHGRLDASGRVVKEDARRELFDAMVLIGQTGRGPDESMASIGCSIKWRD